MGRPLQSHDGDDLERYIRKQNAICSREFLDTLISHHGSPSVNYDELEPIDQPEPEPVDVPEPVSPFFAGINRIEKIKRTVCIHFGISKCGIESNSRMARFVRPRQIAMYLARKHTDHSFPEIGRRFGGRDHTTILHAFDKIEDLRERDEKMAADLGILEAAIL